MESNVLQKNDENIMGQRNE